MGYLHINNLYKDQRILAFRQVYAMEKIHGTSAHVGWGGTRVSFFSGGESHDRFKALFDEDMLIEQFRDSGPLPKTIYGEAYGGKQQGMSRTYGPDLRFIAFDVKIGDSWLSVPQASAFAQAMMIEFVDYALVSTDVEVLDAQRDQPSVQAVRNGVIDGPKVREGIVLRPPFEVTLNNGERLIAKHKSAAFSERGRPSLESLDPTKREVIEKADAVATEWVTEMRLTHVIDRLVSSRDDKTTHMNDTGRIIDLMVEDVTREGAGEIVDNPAVRRAIGQRAARLFKARVQVVGLSGRDGGLDTPPAAVLC